MEIVLLTLCENIVISLGGKGGFIIYNLSFFEPQITRIT